MSVKNMEQNFQKQYDLVPPSAQTPPMPPEKPRRGISTWLGALIIVIVSVLLFGGIFAYQRSIPEPQIPVVNNPVILSNQIQKISEESIVAAVGDLEKVKFVKNDGFYRYENLQQKWGISITNISKGDINGDIFEDAFVHLTTCGASCGSGFVVVLGEQQGNQAFLVTPEGFVLAGAGQYGVSEMVINNRIISITAGVPDYQGIVTNQTFNYELVGSMLEGQQNTNNTSDWKTYTNTEYGFEVKYPQPAWMREHNEITDWYGGKDKVTVKKVATISPDQIGREVFAHFYVSSDSNAVKFCNKPNLNGQAADITETKTINGVTFKKYSYVDSAMAGQRNNITQYSIVRNNICYLLQGNVRWTDVQFVHGATDGKTATQEELSEQDDKIKNGQQFVDDVISTFKFTK